MAEHGEIGRWECDADDGGDEHSCECDETVCMAAFAARAGHKVEREKTVTISYMGTTFDEKLRCDLLVDDCLVIEAKSVESCDLQRFRMQLLSYMKLMDKPLGLVMNFGEEHFASRGIRRVILKNADKENAPF